jgi:3-dehydroquinate dehydratase II
MVWLGKRQPEIYGTTSAAELDALVLGWARERGMEVEIAYTNHEGEAIDRIYAAAAAGIDGLIMNPAGFLYAGYALRDCLRAVRLPYIEVHMSNLEARGLHSVMAGEADGMITGLGIDSYPLALDAMLRLLARR